MLRDLIRPGCVRSAATAGVALLGLATAGCYCFEYRYVSFESQPEFVVVKRSIAPVAGSIRTFPRVPTEYRVTRADYELEVATGKLPYPTLGIRALDVDGRPLQIFAPDMAPTLTGLGSGPRIPKGIGEGEWSFDVLRDGEKIARETFHYEIRSRSLACGLDLP